MPILEVSILGSIIEINYQESEKEKLNILIDRLKNRLADYKNLEGKVTDNKIFFLIALKLEDEIYEIKKSIDKSNINKNNDKNIKEIVNLKDNLFSLTNKNKKLEEQNFENENKMKLLNKKIISLIERMVNIKNHEN